MKKTGEYIEKRIKEKLAKKNYEVFQVNPVSKNLFQIEANMLQPIKVEGTTLHVSMPIQLLVELNNKDEIISSQIINFSEAIKAAETYLERLISTNKLYGFDKKYPADATHFIEKNKKGQLEVKRGKINTNTNGQ